MTADVEINMKKWVNLIVDIGLFVGPAIYLLIKFTVNYEVLSTGECTLFSLLFAVVFVFSIRYALFSMKRMKNNQG